MQCGMPVGAAIDGSLTYRHGSGQHCGKRGRARKRHRRSTAACRIGRIAWSCGEPTTHEITTPPTTTALLTKLVGGIIAKVKWREYGGTGDGVPTGGHGSTNGTSLRVIEVIGKENVFTTTFVWAWRPIGNIGTRTMVKGRRTKRRAGHPRHHTTTTTTTTTTAAAAASVALSASPNGKPERRPRLSLSLVTSDWLGAVQKVPPKGI